MAKILITGGAGFIGFSVARKLSENGTHNITVVDNLLRGKMDAEFAQLIERKNIRFVNGDLTDPRFFTMIEKDYDYIYHFAGVVGVKHVMLNPDKVLYVNAVATLNLFEYAKHCTCLKKIFFSSTSEIYSGTLQHFGIDVPTNEDVLLAIADIRADRTSYALSKMYGESIGFIYGRKYNIPVAIGRYHNVYGPRMGFAHVIPEMFIKMSKSTIIDVASPSHTRAFCFIDDAVEFTVRTCESPAVTNDIVHIGNPKEEISIRDLVMKIAEVIGKSIIINNLPDTPGSPQRRCPDTTKIERLTEYSPIFTLDAGIRKTYDWYRDKLDARYE